MSKPLPIRARGIYAFVILSAVQGIGCGAPHDAQNDATSELREGRLAPLAAQESTAAVVRVLRLNATPNEQETPGALCSASDTDFDGFRYAEHIAHCKRDVSGSKKRSVKASYGLRPSEYEDYQVDHRISLSIGGSNARANLWPLKIADAQRKARLEAELLDDVSNGRMTQASAIEKLLNWR
jgi:hypothetical protein